MPRLIATTIAIVALVVVVAAALTTGIALSVRRAATSDVIPPLPLGTPVASPPTTANREAGVPTCTAKELTGAVIGTNGTGGHVLVAFGFSSRGQFACYLQGTPSVVLIDAHGRTIPLKQRPPFIPSSHAGLALVIPGPPAAADHLGLKYGQAALSIDWISQPESCPDPSSFVVATARIFLSTGGDLKVAVPPAPAAYGCAGVGVGNFESPLPPGHALPPPALPEVALHVPAEVAAGNQLRYQVTLTNQTKTPIDFASVCPTYEAELFVDLTHGSPPLWGKHLSQLNCARVAKLLPAASATFEMAFAIPADAAPDTYTFVFMLGYANAMSKHAEAKVRITKRA